MRRLFRRGRRESYGHVMLGPNERGRQAPSRKRLDYEAGRSWIGGQSTKSLRAEQPVEPRRSDGIERGRRDDTCEIGGYRRREENGVGEIRGSGGKVAY